MQPLDWLFVAGAAGIWGASFLFIEIGLEAFEPGLITWLRVAFGFVTIASMPAARQPVEAADRRRLVALGVVWMACPLTLFPLAQQWIDSALTGMLNSAMPVMTVLIAWLAFATPTGPRRLVGVGVGLIGVVLIGLPEATGAGTNAIGVLMVVAAVTFYGVAVNLTAPLQAKYGSPAVLSRVLATALVLTAPYGAVGLAGSEFAWDSLIACVVLGAGGTGVAYFCAASLAGRVGAVRASVPTYIIPAVSIALGVVFRDETVTAISLIGTGVVLLGAYLASRAD